MLIVVPQNTGQAVHYFAESAYLAFGDAHCSVLSVFSMSAVVTVTGVKVSGCHSKQCYHRDGVYFVFLCVNAGK